MFTKGKRTALFPSLGLGGNDTELETKWSGLSFLISCLVNSGKPLSPLGLNSSPEGKCRGKFYPCQARASKAASSSVRAPKLMCLHCQHQVALCSLLFNLKFSLGLPCILVLARKVCIIYFLKSKQFVKFQPNSICCRQEQRRKENNMLFRPQGASCKVKCPSNCAHILWS